MDRTDNATPHEEESFPIQEGAEVAEEVGAPTTENLEPTHKQVKDTHEDQVTLEQNRDETEEQEPTHWDEYTEDASAFPDEQDRTEYADHADHDPSHVTEHDSNTGVENGAGEENDAPHQDGLDELPDGDLEDQDADGGTWTVQFVNCPQLLTCALTEYEDDENYIANEGEDFQNIESTFSQHCPYAASH